MSLSLTADLYPFWAESIAGSTQLKAVEFFAEMQPGDKTTSIALNDKADQSGNSDTLALDPALGGLLAGALTKITLPPAITPNGKPFNVFSDNNSMRDLWISVTWGKG